MGEVIDLVRNEPTLAGPAHCLKCQRQWTAVAPVGTTQLECPDCHSLSGIFDFLFRRDEEEWSCSCGNDLFYVARSGIYCPNCGKIQNLGK